MGIRRMCSLATSAWAASSPLRLVVDAVSAASRRAAVLMRKALLILCWSEREFAGRPCEADPEAARSAWPCTVFHLVQLMQECASEVAGSSACLRGFMCDACRFPSLVSGHECAVSDGRGVSVWSPRSDFVYSAPEAVASPSSAADLRVRPGWPQIAEGQRRAWRFDP